MILHCSKKKFAAKLHPVSQVALEETHSLGSWHGHLYAVDRRQCVMFWHDATRFVLFMAGWRKAQFAELSGKRFPRLLTAALAKIGCTDEEIRKVELALGPVRYDTATDRSVQGSMRIAWQDLDAQLCRVPDVMMLDPLAVASHVNDRPTTIYGRWLWPDRAMREAVERFAAQGKTVADLLIEDRR
jgi:hypothetical protein